MSEFERRQCPACFMLYGVPQGFEAARREDSKVFWCPGCGESRHYPKDGTAADKLRRERDRLKQQLAEKDDRIAIIDRLWSAAETRASKAEKQVKRVEKRAHAGLCPCCNRSFAELAKHIATKHPTFRAEEVARENVVALVRAKAS